MKYKVDNAVIMAAGTSSRFAPLSYEMPKALITVKGEVLIERQISQLQSAGIKEIIIVVGYKKEQFSYLKDKFNVRIVENNEYLTRNNNSSIFAVREFLRNTYICSADNYFSRNPFEVEVEDSYYAALYSKGDTNEWCMAEGEDGYVSRVKVGGSDTWFMMGHTFWNEEFSKEFIRILMEEYDLPETANVLWEDIYSRHLSELKMKIKKYSNEDIFEFDTLDELRQFDKEYVEDTHSEILKNLSQNLECKESEITRVSLISGENNAAAGFNFNLRGKDYQYFYEDGKVRIK